MRTASNQLSHFDSGLDGAIYTNRVGATTVIGAPYAVDSKQTDGDSTTIDLGLDGLLVASNALVQGRVNPIVISQEAAADNATCRCVETTEDGVRTRVRVNGVTVAIAKGDKLIPHTTAAAFIKQATSTNSWVAIALQAATTDGALIDAIVYKWPKI